MAAAVASPTVASRFHDDVFASVFPKTNLTTPTPESTPAIGTLASPGQPFGGFDTPGNAPDEVNFNRTWSTATRYLTLPPGFSPRSATLDRNVLEAVSYLLQSYSSQRDLSAWYSNEINVHFRDLVLPELQAWQRPISMSQASEVLKLTLDLLRKAQQHYLGGLDDIISHLQDTDVSESAAALRARVKQTLHTLILHSLPRQRLQKTLASVMYQQMQLSLQSGSNPEKCLKGEHCHCKLDISGLPLKEFHDVGLGGIMGERAFAHAAHRFLQGPAIERRCFEVDWTGHSSVVPRLRSWISQHVLPVVESALGALTGTDTMKLAPNDAQQFISMAITNLGRLRTHSLFDYIKTWPASSGAILDVWEYLNAGGPADKAFVCQHSSEQIQRRLLHAGATTSEILSIYVNVIHAFKSLDSRGVLLEKVGVPIRNYLRSRDDTVSIIAASFLADIDADGNVGAADMDKICPDITVEVSNTTLEASRDKKTLNWDDMEWQPDPIDAGPDYKSSKSEDVVAHVLGLFEQEEFIKEVTTVLAQHLLHATDAEYVKETRLVELFKSRLDATKLQAAEVMLKDMRDSVALGKRINPRAVYDSTSSAVPSPREIQAAIPDEGITLASLYSTFEHRMKRPQFLAAVKLVANKRNDLFFAKRTRIPSEAADSTSKTKEESQPTNFKAQLLSSFFWPQLRSNTFSLPPSLEPLRATFEERFGALGSQRKLHFRPALARVSLRLDLEDRTVEEKDIPGWRASVIDAFTSAEGDGLTPQDLMENLEMEEELVTDALNHWTHKRILYQPTPTTYAVLENLSSLDDASTHHTTQQQSDTISAIKSQDAMLRENAPMFETFIANMLQNQGAKAVGGPMGIAGLLRMVLPSFTYGEEETRLLLEGMERKGVVVREGEVWRAK